MQRILYVILAAALFAGASSCQKSAGKTNELTVVLGTEPVTIDPALNNVSSTANYLNLLFEGLYKYADNGSGDAELVPGLAEDAPKKTVNADGSVIYTYTLRDGLKWSDGKPFTANDIVYSWRRLVDPKTTSKYNYIINMVENAAGIIDGQTDPDRLGVKALDDRTVEITLTYDCPFFVNISGFTATFPVKQDIIEKAGDSWTLHPATYISNGPYRLKEWAHNSHLTIEKNPYYYAPVPGPDTIKFMLMDNNNAILAGFLNGEIDFFDGTVPVDEIQELLDSGKLKTAPTIGVFNTNFNNMEAPFNDERVRKAFSLAVDRNYLVNQITRAGQKPAGGFVPYGVVDAAGAGSDFRKIGGNYYSIAEEDYQKNVAEAQRLMAEAGYPDGAGFPVIEYLSPNDDEFRAIAETLQDMWKTALGVNLTLSNQDWTTLFNNLYTDNFQIAYFRWVGDYNDPINFLEIFTTGNGNNTVHYANAEFDSLVDRARYTTSAVERMKLMHEAEDILIGRDMATCPIFFESMTYMASPRISGLYYDASQGFFFENVKIAPQ
jgi:oligopeptide transport system substrate-binding protein